MSEVAAPTIVIQLVKGEALVLCDWPAGQEAGMRALALALTRGELEGALEESIRAAGGPRAAEVLPLGPLVHPMKVFE